jgi:propanol-preferring alcohol dehydrogenase
MGKKTAIRRGKTAVSGEKASIAGSPSTRLTHGGGQRESFGFMRAMVLEAPGQPLRWKEVAQPKPSAGEVLLRVGACAVCRTDLHVVDGELSGPKLPLIPGHEIVGTVVATGANADRFKVGDRVGVPWLGWTCGKCVYCRSGRENLCDQALFTGYTLDGGYAEFKVADQRYCFRIPDMYHDAEAAPLLCAGLIGYRSLAKTMGAKRVGLYGFGAAAHIVSQVARFEGREIYAFTRDGDAEGQKFAKSLGAVWAGSSSQRPPKQLDAAILFAPVGQLVPLALKAVAKGGIVVCGGIHMSDIPSFPYSLLWEERSICSVANLTRQDGDEFLALAPRVPVKTSVETFPLAQANEALSQLRTGRIKGAAVLIPK